MVTFKDFPDFKPNLTPKQVLRMGSFGGTYFRDIKSGVTDKKHSGKTAIREYLNTVFHLDDFEIIHSESGVIPMGRVSRVHNNPFLLAIGSNAGAIRPSSGYAFSFIQKQIEQLIRQNTNPKSPHKRY